jgi:hypothetical protein
MKYNPNKRKGEGADRFMTIGIKRATIYRWIKLVVEEKKASKGSGRSVKIATTYTSNNKILQP